MMAVDIWSANKFIREPVGDGGSPRIPTLKVKGPNSVEVQVNNNEEKARIFAKLFFPPPPPALDSYKHFDYPEPIPDPPQVSVGQILRHIAKLSPYKAHGSDGIPNIVLQKCAIIIIGRLTHIFRAIITQNLYYKP
jgi:hypothetical protein